ncbi:MAG: tyrosine-type recombinase/integrase [Clostridium sp.]
MENKLTLNIRTNEMEQYHRDIVSFFRNEGDKHFIEKFLEIKGIKSENTEKTYRNAIKSFFNKEIENITIDEVVAVQYYQCYEYLQKLTREGLASGTVHNRISCLSSFYKWLTKHNSEHLTIISNNPFAGLKDDKPKLVSEETQALTQEELIRLMNSIEEDKEIDLRDKALLSLAFTTALRKSDIRKLKLKDIFYFQGVWGIKVITEKGKKIHNAKLTDDVKRLIDKYLEISNRNYEDHEEDYIFRGTTVASKKRKEMLSSNIFNHIIKTRLKNCDIKKHIKVHSTRHTSITMLYEAGVPLVQLQEFANHSQLETTRRYIKANSTIANSPADKIKLF